jgi:hypothetical protein
MRVVYFFVWCELRRRRRLRTGTWQFTCLENKCINGTLLEGETYLLDDGGDLDSSCEPWSSQCRSLLKQLPSEALDRIRQVSIRDDGTFSEQQIIEGVSVSYIAPTIVDIEQIQSGQFLALTRWWAESTSKRGKIEFPPGSRLRAFARWVYPRKDYERVFKQHFADMDFEYIEALAQNDPWKAGWLHVRGIFGFWATVVLHANVKLISAAVGIVRATFGL